MMRIERELLELLAQMNHSLTVVQAHTVRNRAMMAGIRLDRMHVADERDREILERLRAYAQHKSEFAVEYAGRRHDRDSIAEIEQEVLTLLDKLDRQLDVAATLSVRNALIDTLPRLGLVGRALPQRDALKEFFHYAEAKSRHECERAELREARAHEARSVESGRNLGEARADEARSVESGRNLGEIRAREARSAEL